MAPRTGFSRTLCESKDLTFWHSPDDADAIAVKFADGRPDRKMQWELKLDVRNFGAKLDGVTDDHDALVAMVAAKDASPNGAQMHIPEGRCSASPGIDLGVKPFILTGGGCTKPDTSTFGNPANFTNYFGTVVQARNASADLFTLNNTSALGGHIRDIGLLGPGSGTSWGLSAYGNPNAFRLTTRNLVIANFYGGLDPGGAEESIFHNTVVLGCGGYGVRLALAGVNPNPTSCRFEVLNGNACGTILQVDAGQTLDFLGLILQGSNYGAVVTRALKMEMAINHCETFLTAGVLFKPGSGAGIQHLNFHGQRAADATSGIVFDGSDGGPFTWLQFHHMDMRGASGAFTLPSFASNVDVWGVQSASGVVSAANGASGINIVNQGVRYFGTANANGLVSERSGSGTPEGAVTARIGSKYSRTDGGAGTSFYVKESNDAGATGWVGK